MKSYWCFWLSNHINVGDGHFCENTRSVHLVRVWKENERALRSLARRVVWNRDVVDDVLQESFLRILKSKRRFTCKEEVYNYARKAVVSAAIDLNRRARKHYEYECGADVGESAAAPGQQLENPFETLVREERATAYGTITARLRQALGRLPRKQREAIDFFFRRKKETKLKLLCREWGIPYSTLRSRMLQGIDSLRKDLKEQGIDVLSLPDGYEDDL